MLSFIFRMLSYIIYVEAAPVIFWTLAVVFMMLSFMFRMLPVNTTPCYIRLFPVIDAPSYF